MKKLMIFSSLSRTVGLGLVQRHVSSQYLARSTSSSLNNITRGFNSNAESELKKMKADSKRREKYHERNCNLGRAKLERRNYETLSGILDDLKKQKKDT